MDLLELKLVRFMNLSMMDWYKEGGWLIGYWIGLILKCRDINEKMRHLRSWMR